MSRLRHGRACQWRAWDRARAAGDEDREKTTRIHVHLPPGALVDHRWPVTALALDRRRGLREYSMPGRPRCPPGLLPVNTVVPITLSRFSWTCGLRGGAAHELSRRWPPSCVAWTPWSPGTVTVSRIRGWEELFDACWYHTRDGLLGIGARPVAVTDCKPKTLSFGQRPGTIPHLGRRMRMRLEPLTDGRPAPEDDPRNCSVVFRQDAADYRRGRCSRVPGRPVLTRFPSPLTSWGDPFRR